MKSRDLLGKKIVGVITDKMSSNSEIVQCHEGLVLEDRAGHLSVLRWMTLEETDGGEYGTLLIYPGREVRPGEHVVGKRAVHGAPTPTE